jgi:hypothetical protein
MIAAAVVNVAPAEMKNRKRKLRAAVVAPLSTMRMETMEFRSNAELHLVKGAFDG